MASLLIFAIVIATFLTPIVSKDYTIADFKKNYFKIITATKGFYEVKAGFENVTNEIVINTGFVNKDLYVDIITVTKDKKSGHFYIYDDEANMFKLNMITPKLGSDEIIVNIKLTQVKSNNGYPDAVMITQSRNDGALITKFAAYSIAKESSNGYEYSMTPLASYSLENTYTTNDKTQEPFNIQIFEDNTLIDYWLMMMTDGLRVLHYYDKSASVFKTKNFKDILDENCSGCTPLSEIDNKFIPAVYTSAFIDINRDCRADIVLETRDNSDKRYLEFYYYINNSKYGLIKVVNIPKDYSLGTVEDINENNNPDLLFVDNTTHQLKVFLNSYVAANKNSNLDCATTVTTEFLYPSLVDSNDKSYILTQDFDKRATLTEESSLGIYGFIKLGDLDLDSYKDLTLNLTINGVSDVYIFLNKPCDASYISDNGLDPDLCRYFDPKAITDEDASVMKHKNAIQTIYFDLGERG